MASFVEAPLILVFKMLAAHIGLGNWLSPLLVPRIGEKYNVR